MTDDLRKIERRTMRYFYDDGLVEIAVGVVLLMLGGFFFGQRALPPGSLLKNWLDSAFVLVFLALVFIGRRLLRFLKFRITYPRTGYVAYKKKDVGPRRRVAAAVSGGIIAAALSTLLAVAPSLRAWLPGVNGVLLGAAVYLFARRTDIGRFYVLAAASAIIGLALAYAGFGDIEGVMLYYAVLGAAVAISGLAALAVYLHRSRDGREGSRES
jgi:hypothetical protein